MYIPFTQHVMPEQLCPRKKSWDKTSLKSNSSLKNKYKKIRFSEPDSLVKKALALNETNLGLIPK